MKKFLVALALSGFVDAISYMVVAPSIIFYILGMGGTKEQYGLVLGAFSLAAFCAKPITGAVCDKIGFRIPFMMTQISAAMGGLLYLIASSVGGSTGIAILVSGRLLGGVGVSNSALGFAYIAKSLPNDEFTKTNSLLSMSRLLGMAVGPGMNVVLANVDFSIGRFHLDSLNSVGLVLIAANLLAMSSIYMWLDEPQATDTGGAHDEADGGLTTTNTSKWGTLCAIKSAKLLVPMLSIYNLMANFQLTETSFAPAANHALGWGPVQVSTVLGCLSVVIFTNTMVVYRLSMKKVRDEVLLLCGVSVLSVAQLAVYLLWKAGVKPWHFYMPLLLTASCSPFIGAPTRALFTKNVAANPTLQRHKATMQAILSMAVSVAGFTTPPFVATFCLRHPDQVEASKDNRELSPWALLAPALSIATLLGLAHIMEPVNETVADNSSLQSKNNEQDTSCKESTALLNKSMEIEEETL